MFIVILTAKGWINKQAQLYVKKYRKFVICETVS